MEHRYQLLTSKEIKGHLSAGIDTVIFPIGSLEQHGPHAPVGTDGLIPEIIATKTAEKLGALCLPPLWYGVSPHHMMFSGSITIRPQLLAQLVEDVLESLIHHGFQKILIFNGHGGNTASIDAARNMVRYRHPKVWTFLSSVWTVLADVYEELPIEAQQENWRTMIAHGGLLETSIVMAVEKDAVKLEEARPVSVKRYVQATDPALAVTVTMKDLSDVGSNGDATQANEELGRMFIDRSVSQIVKKYQSALDEFVR